jgi:hypothetical protein
MKEKTKDELTQKNNPESMAPGPSWFHCHGRINALGCWVDRLGRRSTLALP